MATKGIFLLSIGDELLDGRTQNTNATWFGEQLRMAGVPVSEVRCISDDLQDIVSALKQSEKYPIVIATGGLGPTNDDRTMQGAAKAFGKKLIESKKSLHYIQKKYEARNMELTPIRRKQALLPIGSKILQNPNGTAPGIYFKKKNTHFYFLPGPPSECRPMFEKNILPLARKKTAKKRLVHREFWRTFGRGEGDTYQRIAAFVKELESYSTVTFGVHISFPYIDLTLEVWAMPGEKRPSSKMLQSSIEKINEALGSLCFTKSRETLPDFILRSLRAEKRTLAVAESCTGGMLSKLLTDIPGSSDVFLGGAVTYANSAKEIFLGVRKETLQKFGAVSSETVKEMANGVRKKLGADYALSLSGISGPGGGSAEKPVGTIYVGLSSSKETKTMHQVILQGLASRDQNRVIAVHFALDALRAEILSSHANRFPLS